ncbi:MAG: hypothetical protein CM1200mP25_2790 [Acidobacteriota bacterium]|nr:MAG: hypothetical protein CM1200mP25_2790 [Acidobacteriota bacterium]
MPGFGILSGGDGGPYEKELAKARLIATDELSGVGSENGWNAVVGIDIDYEVIGKSGFDVDGVNLWHAVTIA